MFQTLHIRISLNRSDTVEVLRRICALFLLYFSHFQLSLYVSYTEVQMTDAAGTHCTAAAGCGCTESYKAFHFWYSFGKDFSQDLGKYKASSLTSAPCRRRSQLELRTNQPRETAVSLCIHGGNAETVGVCALSEAPDENLKDTFLELLQQPCSPGSSWWGGSWRRRAHWPGQRQWLCPPHAWRW